MRIEIRGILLISLFTLAIIFLNQNFRYTGYAVAEPSINIQLDKDKYLPNQKLQGTINMTFTGNIDRDSEIKIKLNGKIEKLTLLEYLSITNKSYKATEEQIVITKGETIKNLILSEGQESLVGFKLPQLATVNNIVMSVKGSPTNPPRLLSLDIPEESGKPEWKYIGPFLNTYSSAVYPKGLNIESEGSIQYLDSNLTYYCQQIDLPYAKNYQISAKYAAVSGSTANLEAVILSFDGGLAYGGGQKCTLPRGGTIRTWNSCNITLEQGIQGYYLVCLKIDKEQKSYEISRDDSLATSKYNCDIGYGESWGYAICNPVESRNYFIRISPGVYNENLNGIVTTQQFNEWVTDSSFTDSLTNYLESCQADQIGDCPVIMKLKSEKDSSVELRDLRIDYTEIEGGSSYTNRFYDLSTTRPEIYEIGNQKIENVTLLIPLSIFNITTPNVTRKEELELYVDVAGNSDTVEIEVYSTEIPEEFAELDDVIEKAGSKLSKIKTQEVSWVLNVEQDIQKLTNYKVEVQNIKNMNISLEEKEGRLADIQDEIINYIQGLPDTINQIAEMKDVMIVNPSDVEDLFTDEAEEIFQFQEKANVNVAVATYKVTKHDGSSDVYSIIKKTIIPKSSMKDVYVYEIIPKDVAQMTSDIIFEKPTFEIEMEDPVIKYYHATLTSTTISYAVMSMVTQQKMYKLKTIIVPKRIPTQIPGAVEYSCGDGICSRPEEDETLCPEDCEERGRIPWLWITIILFILVLGLVYINFYRGKLSLGKIARKKSPFKTEKDLENVKNYIKGQLEKKVEKSEISKALLDKGWTKEQVEYAFEDIKWDKKREETMKKAPAESEDMKKLTTYIATCRKLNIPEEKITQTLKAKGWKDSVIKEGLTKARQGQPTGQTIQSKQTGKKEKEQKTKPFFEGQVKK